MPKPWTLPEVSYLVDNAHHKLPGEIAADLGRTKGSVRSFAYRRNIITRDALRRMMAIYERRDA